MPSNNSLPLLLPCRLRRLPRSPRATRAPAEITRGSFHRHRVAVLILLIVVDVRDALLSGSRAVIRKVRRGK